MNTRSRPHFATARILAMTAVLLVSLPAMASHHGAGKHHKMPAYSDFDLNGDGAIVAAEFYEARAARMADRAKAGGKMKNAANAPSFESLDLNDDGEISDQEFAAHQADMKKNKMQRGKKKQKNMTQQKTEQGEMQPQKLEDEAKDEKTKAEQTKL